MRQGLIRAEASGKRKLPRTGGMVFRIRGRGLDASAQGLLRFAVLAALRVDMSSHKVRMWILPDGQLEVGDDTIVVKAQLGQNEAQYVSAPSAFWVGCDGPSGLAFCFRQPA